MEVNNFNQWLNTLSEALNRAKAIGMNEDDIRGAAAQLGSYLAKNIDPDIGENMLLKGLWENGTQEEREALTNMVIKFIENQGRLQ